MIVGTKSENTPSDIDSVWLLLGVALDFSADGDGILGFLRHIGFDLCCVRCASELVAALPAHYRIKRGMYDVASLERDLVTWAPVAHGIFDAMRAKPLNDGTLPN